MNETNAAMDKIITKMVPEAMQYDDWNCEQRESTSTTSNNVEETKKT